ncbi:class I SAM-dependent methyltransferase [Protaetiibacter larvae]|uniref:Class I SAM-dependent methyltransferase n=1 Tax=Protaetiibacter larvae TaxID=2592654 RepID=A0A5C1YB30_9MICO|nr:class I SAM-dependent methyltransferase [Protaetiibacter larvae]QEO10465.1 class I SAM-dependent methyltransferase [Protaetiibacter larvae]
MERRSAPRWNHNLHYHRVVLQAIPRDARSALDVGTGNGMLAAGLRGTLADVTGIDVDADVLDSAAAEHTGIAWILDDVMTHDFGRTFDVVASVATLHHLPELEAALRRLAELTSPGGVLVIVGLARDSTAGDRARSLLGVVQHQWYSRTRNYWEHTAPTSWPPPHSYSEVRQTAAALLPGARWQRFALWRYALTWHRPEIEQAR